MGKEYRKYDPDNDTLNYIFEYNSNETKSIKEVVSNKKKVDIADLRRIALWKIDRVLDVPEDVLNKINNIKSASNIDIDSENVKDLIESLLSCQGIGMPMASAILKFINPSVFPIIDIRAYRALYGKKIYYSTYNVDLYIKYVKELKTIADKKEMSLSKVDEQLYCFDDKHNGKI